MVQAKQIAENVYWVGATDWSVRNFHGYDTEDGSTYNAYLLTGQQNILIDTVKEPFAEELLARIRSVIDPAQLDVIVANHAEPAHSGALPAVLAAAPKAKLIASAGNGKKDLVGYYGDLEVDEVKSGETRVFGDVTLRFVATPMVHWPDNMVTYWEEGRILFSNDAFGQHFASSGIFDVENDPGEVARQAKKYYANIVNCYTMQVERAMEALQGLDVGMIAPSHGVVWTKPETVLSLYREFVRGAANKRKAVVVFDSMWHSTERMAHAVAEGFRRAGVQTLLCDLKVCNRSDILTELLDARYLAVGSPCLNSNMLPTVAAFLCYLKGLKYGAKQTLVFGSYGWAPTYLTEIENQLAAMKFTPLLATVKQQFRPSEEALTTLRDAVAAAVQK